jgi:REP element-mobilizing transposase RayT
VKVARPFKAGISIKEIITASRSDAVNGVSVTRARTKKPMANTFTSLHYHLVFSTKHRHPWLLADIEQRVWQYLGGIARDNRMNALQIGGVEDHVHILLGMPPTMAVSKAVQLLKGGCSKWIHDNFPSLKAFEWQDGYGAFSVSKSQLPEVTDYVAKQREHHRVKTFQEEFRALLEKHGIAYDERYLWG